MHVGRQRVDAYLEADLVVALAGAAVCHGVGAVRLCGAHQMLGNHRSRERRHERVALEIARVGAQRRQAVLVGELALEVEYLGLDRAAVQRSLPNDVEILAALPDVGRDRDDLGPGLGAEPADGHGGVESARVGKDDAPAHESALQFRSCAEG